MHLSRVTVVHYIFTGTIIPKRYKSEFKPRAEFVEALGKPLYLEKCD